MSLHCCVCGFLTARYVLWRHGDPQSRSVTFQDVGPLVSLLTVCLSLVSGFLKETGVWALLHPTCPMPAGRSPQDFSGPGLMGHLPSCPRRGSTSLSTFCEPRKFTLGSNQSFSAQWTPFCYPMVRAKSCPSDNEVGVCPPSVRTPCTSEVPQGALTFESLSALHPEALVSMPLKEGPKARGAGEPACFVPGPEPTLLIRDTSPSLPLLPRVGNVLIFF